MDLAVRVEQPVHLVEIAHRAQVVGFAVGLEVCCRDGSRRRGVERYFAAPKRRISAVAQAQVVSELMEDRAGSSEWPADELLPQPHGDQEGAAGQFCSARHARGHVEVGVLRVASGRTVVIRPRHAVDETRLCRLRFRARVGVQQVMEQAATHRVEPHTTGRPIKPGSKVGLVDSSCSPSSPTGASRKACSPNFQRTVPG